MNTHSVMKYAGLLAASLLLVACGGPDKAELSRISKKYKHDEDEKLAFKACFEQSSGTKAIVINNKSRYVMQDVPLEVCGCQAKTMSTLFQNEKFDSYSGFVSWMGKHDRRETASLRRGDFKSKMEPKAATQILLTAFEGCTASWVAEQPALSKELLVPYDLDKDSIKLAEKKKKAAARQQAAASKPKVDW